MSVVKVTWEILYNPLIISAALKGRAIKFYTELRTEEYNKIYA